ncbi:MAG: SDR family oxidoreductase [Pseudomonadales bacterium]|nr:SDR family oxidoreductase [Pseudomonadales bacterium]
MPYKSVLRPDVFKDQIIIVTGGGSGIGRCISHEVASLGANVMLLGRTLSKLETVAAEIEEDGGRAECYTVDIRDDARVAEVIGEIVAKHKVIHGLVNNAGGQFPAPMEAISKNGFEAVVKNNLVGGFLMARETFKQSMKENGGSIVNITADCTNGFPNMAHTGAARAGMENLTKTAAWEWGGHGVRVNAVAPGLIASSGFDTYTDVDFKKKFKKAHYSVPLKRLGNEAEISAAVCFLLSPGAAYMSGDMLQVDGGARFAAPHYHMPLGNTLATNSESFDGFHRYVKPSVLTEGDD